MKVSVIVPSYRPQDYLYDCLNALCNQTLDCHEYEIIIVLNGCNQPYFGKICDYIKKQKNKFILLRQTNTPGVSNARNLGIEEAHGNFLTFVDDDDIVTPTYLEELLKVSSERCVGCASMYAFYSNVSEKLDTFLSLAYNHCMNIPFSYYDYRQFLSPPVAKMIHKSIIGNTRFPVDMKKSEDSVFCLQISPRIKDMKLASPATVYYQRLREGSAMRKKESYGSIIKEHLFIEYKYLSVWIKNPFRYNLKFFLSRIVACGRNCLHYIRSQKHNK